jgi:hypothetical protein
MIVDKIIKYILYYLLLPLVFMLVYSFVLGFIYSKELILIPVLIGGLFTIYLAQQTIAWVLFTSLKLRALMTLSSSFIILGAIFKVQHYPGGQALLWSGLGFALIVMLIPNSKL